MWFPPGPYADVFMYSGKESCYEGKWEKSGDERPLGCPFSKFFGGS